MIKLITLVTLIVNLAANADISSELICDNKSSKTSNISYSIIDGESVHKFIDDLNIVDSFIATFKNDSFTVFHSTIEYTKSPVLIFEEDNKILTAVNWDAILSSHLPSVESTQKTTTEYQCQ